MNERTMSGGSPFHPGEVRIQQSLGVAERMEQFGRRVIRDHMPDQHRDFFAQLPFVVLGSVDPSGDAWVTLLTGRPGFMQSPDPKTLSFALPLDPADPVTPLLDNGAAVGLLGIELHSRRRNRMNGSVTMRPGNRFDVTVEHSFGNCPQYIQLRDSEFVRDPGFFGSALVTRSEALHWQARAMIKRADTFFVTSYLDDADGRHVDASHRGGKPGFVRINPDGSLTIPDFAGNLHFNTLGNFLLNPKAGLVFPDFETGDMLHLSGDAEVELESAEAAAFQGAERLWTFRPRQVVLRPAALPLRWKFRNDGWSPNSLMTGDWGQARERLDAAALASSWRPFKVARIVDESSVIRSFHLEPADGKGIIAHEAGQHLPIRVQPENAEAPLVRTYTLSIAPSDGHYRISVKRDGVVSSHLHDRLKVGDLIETRSPAGQFTIDPAETRPAVLMAAGVGITPLLAMLRHLVYEGERKRRQRPAWLFVAARTLPERAFDMEIEQLVERARGAVRVVRVLDDTTGAEEGRDFEATGRIDMALLSSALPFDSYDFYMCGPPPFMQGIYDQLRGMGTPDERIHAEAFGPASLKRTRDDTAPDLPAIADRPVPVAFTRSGKEARWEPGSGTLLELAEARGLTPEFGCRSGSCGSCATRIIAGEVSYATRPQAKVDANQALLCCAMPSTAGGADRLILDL
ncbi:pyridoxamine 5'-phosphate oxidase family protein [Novosphingobium sp.]|uniref:2Fe-2S iron-sulfur cluster-binding protein n=1 Tax=Novosphingobium sp. TaxID=1874826 RepID=UPI00273365EE|nr:pyridoxamine 5'-phosphate oxidase family protein [Novosphingobium sp.]MDP3906710.1 pyridoxamine 5'-phosphate oxidase family protein [Novosphingobium sp.]